MNGIPSLVSERLGATRRGFSCVALHMPKNPNNVGSALRAAFAYSAALVVLGGHRYQGSSTDTPKTYRHQPFIQVDDVFDAIPHDCVPVAVDLVDGAIDLRRYRHPERAFYVFGPEDGTLREKVLSRCRDRVMIPTRVCMNLAATVNVVLYDRMAKESS